MLFCVMYYRDILNGVSANNVPKPSENIIENNFPPPLFLFPGENCRKISKETDKVDTDDEGIEQDHFDEDRSPVASLASSSEDEELPPES